MTVVVQTQYGEWTEFRAVSVPFIEPVDDPWVAAVTGCQPHACDRCERVFLDSPQQHLELRHEEVLP